MAMPGESLMYNVTEGETTGDEATLEGMMTTRFIHLQELHASNTSCLEFLTPSVDEYYAALSQRTTIITFTLGGAAVLIVFALYADTLKHLLKFCPSSTKAHSIFIISIYPLVALTSLCTLVVPRAQLVNEAVTQVALMCCLYKLFCLLIEYCGGESELVEKSDPGSLTLKAGPCCCWPCLACLRNITPTKERILMLRLLILQMPVVQGIFYIIFLMMWVEDEAIYLRNYPYLQPVIVVSILSGMWGITMTRETIMKVLSTHYIKGKSTVLQLVVITTKFQQFIAKIMIATGVFPCNYPITATVLGNMCYHSLVLWEIVVLAIFARILYKRPVPETKCNNLPQQIVSISGTDPKMAISNENDHTSIVVRF